MCCGKTEKVRVGCRGAVLSKVALRERHARSRLQVFLERDRARLVAELHDHVDVPWSSIASVCATSGVMRIESRGDVRCQTGVIAARCRPVAKNVHEPPLEHDAVRKARSVPIELLRNRADLNAGSWKRQLQLRPGFGKNAWISEAHLRASHYGRTTCASELT